MPDNEVFELSSVCVCAQNGTGTVLISQVRLEMILKQCQMLWMWLGMVDSTGTVLIYPDLSRKTQNDTGKVLNSLENSECYQNSACPSRNRNRKRYWKSAKLFVLARNGTGTGCSAPYMVG